MFLSHKISRCPKQVSREKNLFSAQCVNVPNENVKGHKVSHVEQHYHGDFCKMRGTDGGTEEEHTLKGMVEGVSTLDSLSEASTVTDVLSPRPA